MSYGLSGDRKGTQKGGLMMGIEPCQVRSLQCRSELAQKGQIRPIPEQYSHLYKGDSLNILYK
ncbi:MAG TPA: hypothetical protein V6D26_21725 [Stenomitos sp.]